MASQEQPPQQDEEAMDQEFKKPEMESCRLLHLGNKTLTPQTSFLKPKILTTPNPISPSPFLNLETLKPIVCTTRRAWSFAAAAGAPTLLGVPVAVGLGAL